MLDDEHLTSNPWSHTLPPAAQAQHGPPPHDPPLPTSGVAQGSSWDNAIDLDSDVPHAQPTSSTAAATKINHTRVASTGLEGKNQMLLLVFIHGFKGSSDTTFEDFPSRLAHMLAETYPGLRVQSAVYPTYDTRGSLAAAVQAFVEWLTEQCVTLESKPELDPATGAFRLHTGRGGGMGSVKVILAGHSMGGLVAVDAALSIILNTAREMSSEKPAPLWPRICGMLAYDTPYYGVHPGVFRNGFNKYAGYIQTAQTLGTFFAPMGVGLAASWDAQRNSTEAGAAKQQQRPSASQSRSASTPAPSAQPVGSSNTSGWGNWFGQSGSASLANTTSSSSRQSQADRASSNATASGSGGGGWRNTLLATGAVALASGAAASYFNKDKIGASYGWVSDHLAFVSNLWDDRALRKRLDDLVSQPQILFHCFYTRLPPQKIPGSSTKTPERTFVILPPRDAKSAALFTPMDNAKAADEVDAHVSMFNATNNPLYFDLGLRTANLIALCLDNETQWGDQVRSQQESREGGVEEEAGLRFGDEVKRMQAENDEAAQRRRADEARWV